MSITLTDYHDAVTDWLTSNDVLSDWLTSAESYPQLDGPPTSISAYFGVTDWEKSAAQIGDGSVKMDLSCQLLVVFPYCTPSAQLMIREAVMALCLELDGQRFGLSTYPLVFIGAEPDAFEPDLDECICWSLRWTQPALIGSVNSSLIAATFEPTEVYIGLAPDIGSECADDYEQLNLTDEATADETTESDSDSDADDTADETTKSDSDSDADDTTVETTANDSDSDADDTTDETTDETTTVYDYDGEVDYDGVATYGEAE
jgi:hypothetical protein